MATKGNKTTALGQNPMKGVHVRVGLDTLNSTHDVLGSQDLDLTGRVEKKVNF